MMYAGLPMRGSDLAAGIARTARPSAKLLPQLLYRTVLVRFYGFRIRGWW